MTHDELHKLRDVTPYFGTRQEVHDGQLFILPVRTPEPGGDWFVNESDPIMITDANGVDWKLGWLNGERVRRRFSW